MKRQESLSFHTITPKQSFLVHQPSVQHVDVVTHPVEQPVQVITQPVQVTTPVTTTPVKIIEVPQQVKQFVQYQVEQPPVQHIVQMVPAPPQHVHVIEQPQPPQQVIYVPQQPPQEQPLPPGWQEVNDNATGKKYYWNPSSNETTWTRPRPPGTPTNKVITNNSLNRSSSNQQMIVTEQPQYVQYVTVPQQQQQQVQQVQVANGGNLVLDHATNTLYTTSVAAAPVQQVVQTAPQQTILVTQPVSSNASIISGNTPIGIVSSSGSTSPMARSTVSFNFHRYS